MISSNRKFKLCILSVIIVSSLLLVKAIDQSVFSSLFMFITGGYLGANVVQKLKE